MKFDYLHSAIILIAIVIFILDIYEWTQHGFHINNPISYLIIFEIGLYAALLVRDRRNVFFHQEIPLKSDLKEL